MILIEKKWNLPLPFSKEDEGLPLAQKLLFSRGITDGEERRAFLSDNRTGWHDPALFPDMERACLRVSRAIAQKEKILVYGDYDADGITSTALLVLFLKKIGADCSYIIPDRLSEGYGMSEALFSRILGKKPSLVITVDCGVANIDEVASLNRSGIDVIITDHHEVKPVLPAACAVLNAKRADSLYPFSQLSGVGVALKLVQALCAELAPLTRLEDWRAYLDLAALGTIADVVPILDENRLLVKEGMILLTQMKRAGVRALYAVSHQNDQKMTTTSVSFLLIPRINAAGRMGDASRAVELLMTDDEEEAERLAETLSQENTRRQEIELAIFDEAVALLENPEEGTPVVHAQTGPILVCGKDWHPGVIGIVASRLVSRYNRPAIVFTEASGQPGTLKGSARACEGYNILEAILFAQEFTEQFGGHPKAAGISVSVKQFAQFAKCLEDYELQNTDEPYEPSVEVDAYLAAGDLTLETCREIAELAPFGEGNREPRFLARNCRIMQTTGCSKGKHLKLRFSIPGPEGEDRIFDGIAFGMGHLEELFSQGSVVDVVFGLVISVWKSRESLSMHVVDMHFPKSGRLLYDTPDVLEKLYENHLPIKQLAVLSKVGLEKLLPEKEDFKKIYQFLRTRCTDGMTLCDLRLMSLFVSANYAISLHGFALGRVLDVFAEAGLIRIYSRRGQRVCFTLLFVEGKVKLENTPTYLRLFAEGGTPR